jgi:hypothetical protein
MRRGGVAASASTCEQCGASVEEDATVCFTCGAAIGDIETPTQPVPVPRFLRTQILTEVTLVPEEAPATSTTAEATVPPRGAEMLAHGVDGDRGPEVPAHGSRSTEVPESTPPIKRAGAAETLARIAAVPRQLAADAQQLAQAARRASRLSWTLLGISVVVIMLGLVVLSYRLIPGSVPAETIYRDPQGRFSFVQPALWHTAPATDSVTVMDATGISSVRVTVTLAHGQETAAQAADLVGASDGAISAAIVHIGGVAWEEREGTVPLADGTTRYVDVFVTEHDSSFYIVECSTLAATYPTTNQLIFQPLLRSFAFG